MFLLAVCTKTLSVFEELEEMSVRVREADKYEKWLCVSILWCMGMILMKRLMLQRKMNGPAVGFWDDDDDMEMDNDDNVREKVWKG